jgi:two-component system, OmpR family, phosphate regulon sensor histidine kinase PhoR
MALEDQRRMYDMPASWIGRLKRARLVLIAGALVFLALDGMGVLTTLQASIGFLIVAAAAMIDFGGAEEQAPPAVTLESAPLAADWPVETVLSGLPDPVIALDPRGNVVGSNAAARRIAPALTRGTPLLLALRIPEISEAVRRAIESGAAQRVEFFEKVPTHRWSEAFITPVALSTALADRRELVLVTLHDLTPMKQVEEMRADFVANASHELRTPLASLSGFIETLQGPARDDTQARERFLDIMKAQATRMARLIDDLLSLSRIELKAHVLPAHQVDLAPIVRQVADGLQTLAHDRGVEVKIALPPEPLLVRGDRDELIRVFENLIENALKYGAAGKRDHARARHRRQRGGRVGARLRARHRARAPAAADRALLPRRRDGKPGARRHRSRARAGQAHRASPPRPAHHRQRARQGRDVHGASAPRGPQIAGIEITAFSSFVLPNPPSASSFLLNR